MEGCTYIYWTTLGFGQSIEPTIDCRMMDWWFREYLVHHRHCYCNRAHDAIQRNVVFWYALRCQTSIGRSIDRLSPNGLTCFQLIAASNIENATFHSPIRSIFCCGCCWFIRLFCQFRFICSWCLFESSAKIQKNNKDLNLSFHFSFRMQKRHTRNGFNIMKLLRLFWII